MKAGSTLSSVLQQTLALGRRHKSSHTSCSYKFGKSQLSVGGLDKYLSDRLTGGRYHSFQQEDLLLSLLDQGSRDGGTSGEPANVLFLGLGGDYFRIYQCKIS